MIIPNLMVSDMARSLAFYRGTLGLDFVMAIGADRAMLTEADADSAVFAILGGQDGQLMLQTAASLREELRQLAAKPAFTGAIYMRGLDPRPIVARVDASIVVKPVTLQWYGMLEAYLSDPDGYLVCACIPNDPPAG